MKRFLLAVLPLLLAAAAHAQRPTDIWYFGQQAGLTFADGNVPKPLNNGKMSTYEGCAVATTAKGELLFYTTGDTAPGPTAPS
jgi:hypothetical protein